MTKRVLMIEDESDIREVAAMALEVVGGLTVLTANTGEAGLELARAEQPDGILLDVMMPGWDGPETLRRLRDDTSTFAIPVAFMTASVQSSDVDALIDLDCVGVIAKPFDPMTLAEQVRSTFGWK